MREWVSEVLLMEGARFIAFLISAVTLWKLFKTEIELIWKLLLKWKKRRGIPDVVIVPTPQEVAEFSKKTRQQHEIEKRTADTERIRYSRLYRMQLHKERRQEGRFLALAIYFCLAFTYLLVRSIFICGF
ncbi:hypothetical protein [Phaeobacter inhibens]|uniref:hypothetical protein n=1 Tax=Phaeobacter inhibens TaxID=221822 RepID=UPI000C9C38FA|nr:hypothetical protein [Phaeobacter inhibens]AUQ65159.1 hypothetical protein PhaeoP78_00245 [Phaeobacter inhibens]